MLVDQNARGLEKFSAPEKKETRLGTCNIRGGGGTGGGSGVVGAKILRINMSVRACASMWCMVVAWQGVPDNVAEIHRVLKRKGPSLTSESDDIRSASST